MAQLLIVPALIMGFVIGLYELILIHKDENFRGSHWFGHGIHAAIFAIIAVFITMNTEYVFSTFAFLQNIPYISNVIVFRVAVGFIAMIKIHATSAVVKSTVGSSKGMKETWAHSFIVAALIVAAPYIWPFIEPIITKHI